MLHWPHLRWYPPLSRVLPPQFAAPVPWFRPPPPPIPSMLESSVNHWLRPSKLFLGEEFHSCVCHRFSGSHLYVHLRYHSVLHQMLHVVYHRYPVIHLKFRTVAHQRPPVVHHQHSAVDHRCPAIHQQQSVNHHRCHSLVLPPHPLADHHQLQVVYHRQRSAIHFRQPVTHRKHSVVRARHRHSYPVGIPIRWSLSFLRRTTHSGRRHRNLYPASLHQIVR